MSSSSTFMAREEQPARICIFAKPPRPGQVKTRLVPLLGAEAAARLAEAFLLDQCESLGALPDTELILATTEAFPPEVPLSPGMPQWLQGEGDLGARQETILRRATAGGRRAIAIGADVPGLPSAWVEEASRLLLTRDAVLGPSRDGGYYLLGLSRYVPGLLAGIPWSHATTFTATRARLQGLGLSVGFLPEWRDIDRAEDLVELRSRLRASPYTAPRTARLLEATASAGRGEGGSP